MIHRLEMNEKKSKRNLCKSANKRNVALKNLGEYSVEIKQFDLPCRNIKKSVWSIEGRTKQMASVQDNQWWMLEEELLKIWEELLKIRDALVK